MDADDALRMLFRDPGATGIFTDFDGTVAPIVDDPQEARPLDGASEVLEGLARRYALVAVVSGRTLGDLSSRFAPAGVLLAGSYGRERSRGDGRPSEGQPGGRVYEAARAAVEALSGVRLEPKGDGVALHYRTAPEMASEVERVGAELALELMLEVRPGRMVVELSPPGPGKGEAVESLIEEHGLARVLVAGDDVADQEAFALVRGLAVESVLVAVVSEESPAGLVEQADLVADGPGGLVDLLRRLDELR